MHHDLEWKNDKFTFYTIPKEKNMRVNILS